MTASSLPDSEAQAQEDGPSACVMVFNANDPSGAAGLTAAITAHAATTKLSEQPSFYDILCGEKGERLVQGKEECEWHNGLRTIFLSRAKYPNGAVHKIWDAEDPTAKCQELGCVILHNNWIAGKEAKQERFTKNNYWHYDPERRMCMWPWHKRLPAIYLPGKA